MDKLFSGNLEFVREDDYVEYFLFPQLPDNIADTDYQQVRAYLATVLQQCNEIVHSLNNERHYIWHKDEFQLLARTADIQERLLNDEIPTQRGDKAECLPPHLHGVTHYGDNIADEWYIVYLLCELTRRIEGCIARVIDSDGEFLLIEAADVLPKWANPDTCEQRVYIVDGSVQLVQNSPSNTANVLPVATAVTKIRAQSTLYRACSDIQQCIGTRLKEFQQLPNAALHQQIVRLPLGVAALLRERPQLIASAVRSFCERDSIDMKACRTMRFFPPEQRVRTNVRFTRCLYAMLTHSNYVPERKIGWNLCSATDSVPYKEDLLGVKIACGFEILASQAKGSDGDCASSSTSQHQEPAWRTYVKSLTAKGYFRDNVEGSAEYQRLLREARAYYDQNNTRFRTAAIVGKEILELLQSIEVNAEQLRGEENNLQPSDSDDWLNISAEQLDAMLLERYGPKKLYKPNGDMNAEEFTKNLTDFLEKQSAFDGIDLDSDDDSDDSNATPTTNTTSTTETASGASKSRYGKNTKAKIKKNQSMRKACKQNPIHVSDQASSKPAAAGESNEDNDSTHVRNFLDFVIPEDNWDSNSEMSDYEDEDDLERNIEAMTMTNAAANIDEDIKAYMAQMDRELANTTIGQSFERQRGGGTAAKSSTHKKASTDDDFDDIESFEPININVNTLKHMMDSYKSQLGGAGPVSNLLNAMGVGMSTTSADDDTKDLSESTV